VRDGAVTVACSDFHAGQGYCLHSALETVTVTGLRRLPAIALVGVPDPKTARDLIDLAFAGARLSRPRWRLVVEVDVPGADERTVARMAAGIHTAVTAALLAYTIRCGMTAE
jgi:hypothetical protein